MTQVKVKETAAQKRARFAAETRAEDKKTWNAFVKDYHKKLLMLMVRANKENLSFSLTETAVLFSDHYNYGTTSLPVDVTFFDEPDFEVSENYDSVVRDLDSRAVDREARAAAAAKREELLGRLTKEELALLGLNERGYALEDED